MSEERISAKGTLVLCMVLLTASVTGGLAQSFQLYDDFNAPNISKTKWIGGERASQLGLDVSRVIENGQLRLRNRSVGFTVSDSGVGTNFVFLGLPDPEAAYDMKAMVTATNVDDVGCSGNAKPSQSFAGLAGACFNAGTPTNGNETNDVVAAIGISSDSGRIAANKRPRVVSYVLQCADQSCSTYSILDFKSFGPIALGTPVTVAMRWDFMFQEFFFTASGFPSHEYFYGDVVTDTSSPGLPFKHLQAQNDVANCTNIPRPVANISALYDNVTLEPTCQSPGTACSSDSVCCDGLCEGNGNTTCCLNSVSPRTACSSNQDCCPFAEGEVVCGGQGKPHCCFAAGSECADGPDLCCSGTCDVTGSHCL
jgi:hypothetical protein